MKIHLILFILLSSSLLEFCDGETECNSFDALAHAWRQSCGSGTEIAMIRNELNNLKKSIEALKHEKVHFSASSSMRISCHKCAVSYDMVESDSHLALDAPTGRFVAPINGLYLFLFHALAESGSEVQLELMVREASSLCMYDRDLGSGNLRYAMVGQASLQKLSKGDAVYVRLHRGAVKGGGKAVFTSFVGIRVGDKQDYHAHSDLLL